MPRASRLATALEKSLKALDYEATDEAAVELAREYVRRLETTVEARDVAALTLGLRRTLESLGMTPQTRAAMAKGAGARKPPASSVDQLRARREARAKAG